MVKLAKEVDYHLKLLNYVEQFVGKIYLANNYVGKIKFNSYYRCSKLSVHLRFLCMFHNSH